MLKSLKRKDLLKQESNRSEQIISLQDALKNKTNHTKPSTTPIKIVGYPDLKAKPIEVQPTLHDWANENQIR